MRSKQAVVRLDIVFPNLFSSYLRWQEEIGDLGQAPALASYLSNARVSKRSSTSPEALLFSLVSGVKGEATPMAAIRVSADDLLIINDRTVLCADPVSISAGMNDLSVEPIALADEEQDSFVELINEHLYEHDLSFELRDPQTGLCSGFKDLEVNTKPLSAAQAHGLRSTLPDGPSAGFLQSLSTEIQMLLFDAPFNRHREAQGLPPINGLWFWGEGSLPKLSPPYQMLSGGSFVADLARVADIEYERVTPDQVLSDKLIRNKAAALFELAGLDQLDYLDWAAAMTGYEQNLFVPLLKLLKKNPEWEVRVFDDQQRCFTWQRKKWFSFFNKTKPLEHWLNYGQGADE